MQTNFTQKQLSVPAIASSDVELRACLQCDYCTPNCPTYQLLGDEYDSSRGRIYLIKELLESEGVPKEKTVKYVDQCLSCLACMSTCPSSVHYLHLLDHARETIEGNHQRKLIDRMLRWMLAQLLPYPDRFRLAMRGARLIKPFAIAIPRKLRPMLSLTPNRLPSPSLNDKPQVFPALGERKRRVALLAGCAQQTLNTDINDATIRILRRHGCEVVIAQGAGCCGALTHHMGKTKESRAAAARNISAWMKEVDGAGLDAIVINTSGCGTVVKDYGYIFRNDALAEDAATVAWLAKDITELLADIELDYRVKPGLRVAYHATCSLQYGQRIRFKPKKLLRAAGFTVLEPRDSHACCGAAGTYNLLQSGISEQLKARKVKTLEVGAPDVIAAGNIGCMVQIASATGLPVVHTVELLDWVTGGPVPPVLHDMSRLAV
ncbi:MAG: glycolate oxidase subunit GlcF [Candidatus Thiodiazotropha sp. (ex Lucinoma kastoroae)]|nr:glycolate oxidase subunit GlcF [Candidatus Thiodiazotropha sp. (ex Lucinoma kastoroae)]MCU7860091.1 glycolate oxidase subunit GlcF [Candidatus Thiodiazotropha sp. (ex Lucinoma kastoroae)]